MVVLPTCMSVNHMFSWYQGSQKRTLNLLELELQMAISHHVVLGVKPESSERVGKALTAEPSLKSKHYSYCSISLFCFLFLYFFLWFF